jgi:Spy/CpxP family protein refolding chaperone
MKFRTMLTVGAVVALCAASDAWSQERGGGRFGRGGIFGGGVTQMGLLRVDKIREEIKLTDEQQQQVREAGRELAEAARGGRGGQGFQNFQEMTDEERQEFFAQMQERAAERAKAEKAKIAEILEDDQEKRLGEIYVQVAGADALSDADIAAALKITDDQKEKIATARRDFFANMRDQLQDLDVEERRAKMAELRQEADKAVVAVLSEEQQTQFEGMKGEKLELSDDELAQARRGGFGRGGRGGGRGGRGGQNDGA